MESRELVSQIEGEWLIELARNAIGTVFDKSRSLHSIGFSLSLSLHQKRGVFVALLKNDKEINCLGHPLPEMFLEEAVQQYAIQTAEEIALKADELEDIQIKISLMTHPVPIEPDQIEMGTHGLIIKKEEKIGVLLPEVPVDFGWTLEAFLEHLCIKGNLPLDAWKDGAGLYSFTTQVFQEVHPRLLKN